MNFRETFREKAWGRALRRRGEFSTDGGCFGRTRLGGLTAARIEAVGRGSLQMNSNPVLILGGTRSRGKRRGRAAAKPLLEKLCTAEIAGERRQSLTYF